jgi:hypothetical protein
VSQRAVVGNRLGWLDTGTEQYTNGPKNQVHGRGRHYQDDGTYKDSPKSFQTEGGRPQHSGWHVWMWSPYYWGSKLNWRQGHWWTNKEEWEHPIVYY